MISAGNHTNEDPPNRMPPAPEKGTKTKADGASVMGALSYRELGSMKSFGDLHRTYFRGDNVRGLRYMYLYDKSPLGSSVMGLLS